MSSRPNLDRANPNRRTILKAVRHRKPTKNLDDKVITKLVDSSSVSSKHHATGISSFSSSSKHNKRYKGKEAAKIDGQTSVACTKELATQKRMKPINSYESSSSKQLNEDILKQIMTGPVALSKSFKIPKKTLKVDDLDGGGIVPSLPSSPSVAKETSLTFSHSLSSNTSKKVVTPCDDVFSVAPSEASRQGRSDVEKMEWETTVQEIKGLWPGSDFRNEFVTRDKSSVADGVMDMDIDSIYQQQLIIIPDTNIWIHCLDLIRELLDTKFQEYAYPIIVIPWMVLQELDVSGKTPGGPSRNAIHYIHSMLRTNHPRVKGQKASRAAVIHPDFDKRNPDDSILQCAQQHQKENSAVVLVTNDRNMLNKAIVNKILATDSSCGVMGIIDVLNTNSSNSCSYAVPLTSNKSPKVNIGMVPPAGKYCDEQDVSNIPNQKTADVIKNTKRPCSLPLTSNDTKKQKDDGKFHVEPFSDVLDLIHQTLSHVIEIKMKEDYGNPGWLKALKIPPPWTLKSSIQVIIKHWIAVFTEVFGRRMGVAEKLLECISSYEHGLRNASIEKEIIEQVLGLFAAGEFSMSDIVREDSKVNYCRKRLLEHKILNSS